MNWAFFLLQIRRTLSTVLLSLCLGLTLASAIEPFTLPPEIIHLTEQASLSYEAGKSAISKLDSWMREQTNAPSDEVREEDLDRYVGTRNLLFLMTHQARIGEEKKNLKSRAGEAPWRVSERQILAEELAKKEQSLGRLIASVKGGKIALNERRLVSLADLSQTTAAKAVGADLSSLTPRHYSKAGGDGLTTPAANWFEERRKNDELERKLRRFARLPPKDSPLPGTMKTPPDYFNAQKFPDEARFLQALGVRTPHDPKRRSNDLSDEFPAPEMQGESKACSAFAITADMTYELNRHRYLNKVKSLDVEYAYVRILEEDKNDPDPERRLPAGLRGRLRAGVWNIDEGASSLTKAMKLLMPGKGNCPSAGIPAQETLPNFGFSREYVIDSFHSLRLQPTWVNDRSDLIRALIDAGMPPMVVIDTDRRTVNEGWMSVVSEITSMRHVLNIVGYGVAIDPEDMQEKPYFVVRDSLAKTPIHMKVDAKAFMGHVSQIHKINGVKKI